MRVIDADALRDRLQILGYDDWNQGATTTWAEAFKEFADMVDEQPTIDPEPQWIPCSERLPDEKDVGRALKELGIEKRSDYVIATVEVKGKRMTATACTYDGAWDWADFKVVAWMPLPAPYRESD